MFFSHDEIYCLHKGQLILFFDNNVKYCMPFAGNAREAFLGN